MRKTCTNLGGLFWFQTKTTNIFEHIWCFFGLHWKFGWTFAVKLAYPLKLWLKFCSQTCIHLETLIESLQSNFHTPLKVWLKVCSQTFIPPWKFALKVSIKLSYPLEILQWKFQWNFQPNLNYNCSQNAGLKVSVETFKGPWNFHWNFQCKLSGGYESLTANFQSKFQGGMKVWLQTFNQTFIPHWNWHCFPTKRSWIFSSNTPASIWPTPFFSHGRGLCRVWLKTYISKPGLNAKHQVGE